MWIPKFYTVIQTCGIHVNLTLAMKFHNMVF
jgi:hypothetical protein